VGPWEVPELEIRERPPSALRNIDGGPPGGARAGDPEVPTINAKKHRRRAPGKRGNALPVEPTLRQGDEWLQKSRDKCSKSS
jgi:hypothetical protein